MRGLTPAAILQATGGTAVGNLPEAEITAVTIDSREITEGCLFVAIPGSRVDGHDFLAQAARDGAACALCSHAVEAPLAQIVVEDTRKALQAVAAWYRSLFSIPFVGITGSVGKTTAKEMIACVLSARYRTLRTEKNLNNELGVPLTLLQLREDHEAAVVEMGISGFGEMTRLTRMVRPDIGVFTAIGDAHLEFLGDRQGVLRAKAEMVQGMHQEGLVVVNGDDMLLRSHCFPRRTMTFGLGEDCQVRARSLEPVGTEAMRCILVCGTQEIPVQIPAFGEHVVYAALAGACVGLCLGLSGEEIARGIAGYRTVGSRGRVLNTGHYVILDDCYNANPTSVQSAVTDLCRLPGRHVAILGDMRELGRAGPELHRQTGEMAAGVCDLVIACGPEARAMAELPRDNLLWYPDRETLLQALPGLLRQGDAVLVKASRAMGFEKVVTYLLESREG